MAIKQTQPNDGFETIELEDGDNVEIRVRDQCDACPDFLDDALYDRKGNLVLIASPPTTIQTKA